MQFSKRNQVRLGLLLACVAIGYGWFQTQFGSTPREEWSPLPATESAPEARPASGESAKLRAPALEAAADPVRESAMISAETAYIDVTHGLENLADSNSTESAEIVIELRSSNDEPIRNKKLRVDLIDLKGKSLSAMLEKSWVKTDGQGRIRLSTGEQILNRGRRVGSARELARKARFFAKDVKYFLRLADPITPLHAGPGEKEYLFQPCTIDLADPPSVLHTEIGGHLQGQIFGAQGLHLALGLEFQGGAKEIYFFEDGLENRDAFEWICRPGVGNISVIDRDEDSVLQTFEEVTLRSNLRQDGRLNAIHITQPYRTIEVQVTGPHADEVIALSWRASGSNRVWVHGRSLGVGRAQLRTRNEHVDLRFKSVRSLETYLHRVAKDTQVELETAPELNARLDALLPREIKKILSIRVQHVGSGPWQSKLALSRDADGNWKGTPRFPGPYRFLVRARNDQGKSVTETLLTLSKKREGDTLHLELGWMPFPNKAR